jgi:hypothetical protein
MFGWLKGKKETRRVNVNDQKKVKTLPFDYHPKIILAWAKGIDGNVELLNYLYDHGYKELVMAAHAIRLKDEARDWLMDNGFPHIMAMINGAEGNEQAQQWLKLNNYLLFYNMAIAIDGDNEGFKWINQHRSEDIFYLTRIIKKVKDEIEEEHNDTHRMSKE